MTRPARTAHRRPRDPALRLATTLVAVCAVLACGDFATPELGTGGGGGGGSLSPGELAGVQAFGTVVRAPNGTVSARLDVLTLGETPRYLSGIAAPTLEHGGESFPLVTGDSVGVFVTDSRRQPSLTYDPGGSYVFSFSATGDDGAAVKFVSRTTAADDTPQLEIAPFPVRWANEPIEVELFDMANGGVLQVEGPNGVTYATNAVSSLDQLSTVRARMESTVGPLEEIPGTAFPSAGQYRIILTSLEMGGATNDGDADAALGAVSWFGAGAYVETTVTID